MSAKKPAVIGRIPALPGSRVAMAQAGGLMVISNGFARPVVTNGDYVVPSGIRPPPFGPDVYTDAAVGNVTGEWQFFTQLWSTKRGRGSNLSPAGCYCAPVSLITRRSTERSHTFTNGRVKLYLNPRHNNVPTPRNNEVGGILTVTKTGPGALNDIHVDSNTYYGLTTGLNIVIEITAIGATDKFRWSDDGGVTWRQTNQNVVALANKRALLGVKPLGSVYWGAVTGHAVGDIWRYVPVAPDLPWAITLGPDAGDTIRIWANLVSQGRIRMVLEVPTPKGGLDESVYFGGAGDPDLNALYLAQTDPQYEVLPSGEYTAPISLGCDIFPGMEAIESYASRLFGMGQKEYSFPGGTVLVSQNSLLPTWQQNFWGEARAKVTLKPWPRDGTVKTYFTRPPGATDPANVPYGTSEAGRVWELNSATYVGILPLLSSVIVVINSKIVAQINKDGKVLLRGAIHDQPATPTGGPSTETSFISWDDTRNAVRINVNLAPKTTPAATPIWRGCLIFTETGDLYFDRTTTIAENAAETGGDKANYGPVSPESMGYYPYWILFLGTNVAKAICHYALDYTPPAVPAVTCPGHFAATSIVQNWKGFDEYPQFDPGMIYRPMVIGGQYVGNILDVLSSRELLLDRNVTSVLAERSDWKIMPLRGLFYSTYGNPEGGYFGTSMMTEGLGNILYHEFGFDEGLKEVGLSASAEGLQVLLAGREYLLRIEGTQTPIEQYEVSRIRSQAAVVAPLTIARDRSGARLALSCKPLGIGLAKGFDTTIITDAIMNRATFTEEIDSASLANALGAYFNDGRGDQYLLMNLTKIGGRAGEYGLLMNMRGSQPQMTELCGQKVSALTVLLDDYGRDVVVYGGAGGKVGRLFGTTLDLGATQSWLTRVFFSPVDLQPITLVALRLFMGSQSDFAIGCEVFAVGGQQDRTALRGDLRGLYTSRMIIFDRATACGDVPLRSLEPITSSGFVMDLWANDGVQTADKGLEIQFLADVNDKTTRGNQ